jgi:hypothetical protein
VGIRKRAREVLSLIVDKEEQKKRMGCCCPGRTCRTLQPREPGELPFIMSQNSPDSSPDHRHQSKTHGATKHEQHCNSGRRGYRIA